jgi:peroxiredoxin
MTIPRFALLAALAALALPLVAQTILPASDDGEAVAAARSALVVGEPAPDFTVIDAAGREVRLSDFRGKLVLIDIWATWCGPCIAAMPHQSELARRWADDGLVILAICANDTRTNYEGWVRRNGERFHFLTAHDPAGRSWRESVFNTAYGVTGFPTLFLIDREGRYVGQASGGGPNENPAVTRLLARGGLPIDTSHLPPLDDSAPKSIPALTKVPATAAGTTPMMGMGGGLRPATPGARLGSVAAGEMVPDFALADAEGRTVSLADLRGQVTLLTFYSHSERGPEPYAVELWRQTRDQGVAMLAVATAQEEAAWRAFVASAAPDYHAVWDPTGRAHLESVAYMQFSIGMFPGFGVIDREGRLVGGYIGVGDRHAPLLKALLTRAGVTVE